ncbi:hypothetical protein HYH03_002781 [Edaphochlamys debaryana]|uniref:Prolyl 4-hydroxylase alpha subunit Fe(2+) 2OG dioxygenase domain-containing protein n=1 Tax=Edaphochlamys debaryana TaxID=47281 RepID=A0A835YA66_9CHLO|nr:hypothetical protein HYH03_002781 [Edaphochlamys debaryana]|eukprot:KAG2499200.1 hypothetical protein HYH03_002781 [Edaphochlamys debaryana]
MPPQRPAWEQQLQEALDGVQTCGSFAATGLLAAKQPRLAVQGLGTISVPLSRKDAASLLRVGKIAPFGFGNETVQDQSVRRGKQLDASRVRLHGWEQTLQHITQLAVDALGIKGPDALGVEARLYKLLMYEEGGHFLEHRDTEKEPGLPNRGTEASGKPGTVELSYAAFYADCEHQLMPVQSGLRVVLAYNLVRTGPRKGVNTLGLSAEHMEGLAAAVRAWEEAPSAEARGHLLALPLEHKYTETNLSFGGLKGRDHTRVQALLGCGLLEVRLGLLHKHCPQLCAQPHGSLLA